MGTVTELANGEFKSIKNYDPQDSKWEGVLNRAVEGTQLPGMDYDQIKVKADKTKGEKVEYFDDEKSGKMYVFKFDKDNHVIAGASVEFKGSHSAPGINKDALTEKVDPDLKIYAGPDKDKIKNLIEEKIKDAETMKKVVAGLQNVKESNTEITGNAALNNLAKSNFIS